jgi:hypothetical protein
LGKTTWAKQDVPYYITETFYVQNEKGNAELTIGSGAKIKFGPGVSLQVGQSNYGKFVATGVTFTTAAGSPSAGDWAYIWFGEHAAAGSGLSDCVVEYGGSDESYGSVAISANSKVFVQRCTIQNSASYGIYMEFAKPILTQNTFNNIAAENEFTRE